MNSATQHVSAATKTRNYETSTGQLTKALTPEVLKEVLDEIGGVLLKHKCEDQIGVFVRQFHFCLKEGKVLMESHEYEGESYVLQIDRSELGDDVLAKSWLFPKGKPEAYCFCEARSGKRHLYSIECNVED